ncbi:MAG: UDP-2,3-diacylglucosamine diphosphatase [Bacteroidales bacterium]|jgi:UDP-2,3-diacylglucosamine hydrolase|nr:UDP-2,3-diacylglucosamine diphosphatase [Bacteroidales bacterium]
MECYNQPIVLNGTFYFASDFHLGSPNETESKARELLLIKWLDEIKKDASYLFLLGDIFDFWFEYHDVIPKGYYKFLTKLAELREAGIQIWWFTGNHDMWLKNYLHNELNINIIRKETLFILNGKHCLIGHGDGLGDGDFGYKLIKVIFAFRFNQWLYGWFHPRIAFAIARFFSRKSRAMTGAGEEVYAGNDKELIVQHAYNILQHNDIEYFIYGHRHLPLEVKLTDKATYFNCGDWIMHYTYLKMNIDGNIELFTNPHYPKHIPQSSFGEE